MLGMRFVLVNLFQANSIVFLLILVCKSRFHTSLNIRNVISNEQPKVKPNELWRDLVLFVCCCLYLYMRLLISGNKDLHLIAGQNCFRKIPACCVRDKANIFSACVPVGSKPGHSPHSECEYCAAAEVLRAERKWNPFFCEWCVCGSSSF
jgi:hypothetical protein